MKQAISISSIEAKIHLIRGQKVMLDRDLAELYGVQTSILKRQVRRNLKRFPSDFMFELTKEEIQNWRCQIGTSNSKDKMGLRYSPFAFTEHGILMLSSVLNSMKAIEVNIQIMRAFVQLRQMAFTHKDLAEKISELEKESKQHGQNIERVFDVLRQLIHQEEKPKRRMGFHSD